jgi:hypothetical protein
LPGENPLKVPFLKPNPLPDNKIEQISLKRKRFFPKFFVYFSLRIYIPCCFGAYGSHASNPVAVDYLPPYALSLIFPYRSYIGTLANRD